MFTSLRQICTVVDDFETTVTHLVDHLGIGPFKAWHFRPPALFGTTFRGVPATFTMKLALTWLADVQWEVITPEEGPSLYREHLDKHGRGVQHLLMATGNVSYEDASRTLGDKGHGFAQTARVNSALQVGPVSLPALPRKLSLPLNLQFGYIDADDTLRTGIELTRYPLHIPERVCLRLARPEFCIPAGNHHFERSLPDKRVRRVSKLSIVTRDADDAIRQWIEVAGVAPWHVHDRPDARVGWSLIEDVLLEIVQPRAAGPHQQLLDIRGEGVAFVGVEPNSDLDTLVTHCGKLGYATLRTDALVGERRTLLVGSRRFLGTDLELIAPGETMAALFSRTRPDRVVG